MSLPMLPAGPAESGNPNGPAPEGPGVLASAWAGAKRRWFLAGAAGLLLGGIAAVTYYTQTPQKHTVTTTLQITALDPLLHERETRGNQEAEYRKAQAALVRTRPIVQEAYKSKKVSDSSLLRGRPDPVGWLESELKTQLLDGGQVRISLTGENPDELAAILNTVTEAYLRLVVDAEKTQRLHRVTELENVLAASENRVRDQRNKLFELASNLHASDKDALTLKQQTILQQYAALQKELFGVEAQLRAELSQVKVLKAKVEAARTQPLPDQLLADALAADPVVKAAADELGRLRDRLTRSGTTVAADSPVLDSLKGEIKVAEERLAAAKDQRRDDVTKRIRENLVRVAAAELGQHETAVQTLEFQRGELTNEVRKSKAEAETIGLGSLDLEMKRAEIAESEAIMRKLRAEKELLAIEVQTYKRRVNVSSTAEASAARPAASAVTGTAGLGLVGFVFGAMGIGYAESRRRRLVHTQDVARVMRLRVLGSLPHVPGLGTGSLMEAWGDQYGITGSILVEAVNDVRTMLLAGDGRGPQVVMVSSAGQGEGKTTLACLLALSLAQLGKRTLLVDADLRNPQVTARLNLPPAAGLGEVLRGEARPAGVIGGVPGTPLAVLTAGRPCATIIRGLSVDRVRQVFAELRQQFDYIVVDSCPTPLTDGLIIGACTDAALLVVRSGQSEEPVVRTACERMLAARVPLVGAVVNGLPLGGRWLRYPYTALPAASVTSDAQLPLADPV